MSSGRMTISPLGLPDLNILKMKTEELSKTNLLAEDGGREGGISDDWTNWGLTGLGRCSHGTVSFRDSTPNSNF